MTTAENKLRLELRLKALLGASLSSPRAQHRNVHVSVSAHMSATFAARCRGLVAVQLASLLQDVTLPFPPASKHRWQALSPGACTSSAISGFCFLTVLSFGTCDCAKPEMKASGGLSSVLLQPPNLTFPQARTTLRYVAESCVPWLKGFGECLPVLNLSLSFHIPTPSRSLQIPNARPSDLRAEYYKRT
jgi:hypothetical protein